MTRLLSVLFGSLGLTGLVAQQQLPGLADAVEHMTASGGLRGSGLTVIRADAELHRSTHAGLSPDTELPIASASKWLAVATILTLVDEGKLDLGKPVARYVAEFERDDRRHVTLRQCLSCTSGLPASLGVRLQGMDMSEFAKVAADAPLRSQADTAFLYGGVGFQIAAVAAERVTGRNWHELFAARIALPLGMTNTRFGALQPIGDQAGTTPLPWVAGGAVSSLSDYGRFVRMLLADGEFEGRRILTAESVQTMLRDHVPERVVVHPAVDMQGEHVRYGLGTWIQQLDDGVTRCTDPGAFGFTPWIDRDLGIGGVFAVQDRVQRVLRMLAPIQSRVRELVQSPGVSGTVEQCTLRHDGHTRRYELHVPPHDPGESLPLLLVLHGGGGSGAQVRENTGLDQLGLQHGFVVAFPDGTGLLPKKLLTWNSGGIDVHAARENMDDVGFLRAVVADIQRQVSIDSDRVFACGHSNGGMMCHRLAREAADLFAGIAVIEGAMNFTAVQSSQPVAVLIVHGTADEHVRYGGGETGVVVRGQEGRVDASVQQAIDYYLVRNGLEGYPDSVVDGKVRVDTYARSKANGGAGVPVRVVTLDGGGHAWPGARGRSRLLADKPFDWPASRAILEFFAALQLEPRTAPANGGPPSAPR